MENAFQKKVYKLFNNDVNDSQTFIQNIDISDKKKFNIIFPELLKMYKNSLAPPFEVLDTVEKLIDNLNQSGIITSSANTKLNRKIENIKDFFQLQYDEKRFKKIPADDTTDLLNAILQYEEEYSTLKNLDKKDLSTKDNSKWKSVRIKISANINKLISIMIANTDKQVKMEQMVAIMSQIKNTILFVAQDISPIDKREKKEEKALIRKEKALNYSSKKESRLSKKNDSRKEAEVTNEDEVTNEAEVTNEEEKELAAAYKVYDDEIIRLNKDKRYKSSSSPKKNQKIQNASDKLKNTLSSIEKKYKK